MFYESGGDKDTKGPVYGMRFSQNSTRYLIWHMELTNTKASEAIELPMTIAWYDPNGSVFRKQQRKILLAAGAESVQNEYGCGFDEPGKWEAGSYTVDFFVGQLRITRVYFVID